MTDISSQSRQGRVVLPIVLVALLVVVMCGLVMFYINTQNVEQVGVNKAKALADQIKILRTFYTKEVVSRAKDGGLRINYDWEEDPNRRTLPLPATFTNVVGQRIEAQNPGTKIRLYSQYPFPHRKATEKYDDFEMQALKALEKTPDTPFYRFEEMNGRLSVRYAVADLMRPACLECHNNHPETPKTGWKEGDVRGVVEIISPVDQIEDGLNTGTLLLLASVALGLGLVVGVSYFSIKKPIQEVVSVLSSASSQIAATVGQQELTAVEQSKSVTDTTTTMEGISTSSMRMAEQSEVASSGAQDASTLAEEGTRMVQQAMQAMESMKEKVEAIADEIGRLSQQTGQIGGITKLVSDLANQTNLLALNAAVEAARAGEQGKGFAVVAGEIRKLADQSKTSAEKIYALLDEIQKSTNSTVTVTEQGTKTVQEVTGLANRVAEAFSGVRSAVGHAFQSSQQISMNLKQQDKAIKQVVGAMELINTGAQETALGLHETKEGIQTVKQTAERLKAMV